jgi:hypothetical protein
MAVAVAFTLTGVAGAHEGHEHTTLGTVTMIHDAHLEVKDVDGKATTFTLDEATKVLRGTEVAARRDISTGARVAVISVETKDAGGKTTLMAREVRLGASAEPSDKPAEAHGDHH